MKLAAFTRIAAFIALAALFVTDYMFNLWIKEVPREAYLIIFAVALGVDVEFLRGVLINAISKSLNIAPPKEDDR